MKNLNEYIDHTVLATTATKKDIIKLCNEAKEYKFASVCVNSKYVKFCKEQLKDSNVKVCTVVGFPLGAMSIQAKAFEAKQAINDGADEVDMVLDISALIEGDYKVVSDDIKAVRKETTGKVLKVILENCYLTKEMIVKGCELCVEAGVDFVKTSTGFGISGSKIEDVVLMKKTVNNKALVKAAGGIRTQQDAIKIIEAGADRIGTSGGVKIVHNLDHNNSY